MAILDHGLLARLSEQAGQSSRLRLDQKLHISSEAPCQRFPMAMDPVTRAMAAVGD